FLTAEDGIRDRNVTGVQTCALPISYGEKTEDADPDKARAVRQTVADLLDREAISKNVYAGTYTPLYSYIPEGLPGSGTQFKDMYGDGTGGPDPERARKRHEDAGVETPV